MFENVIERLEPYRDSNDISQSVVEQCKVQLGKMKPDIDRDTLIQAKTIVSKLDLLPSGKSYSEHARNNDQVTLVEEVISELESLSRKTESK